jgi:predicted RNA-binding Zn-ribbon protein involved in translation (DUF1610 family)
MAPPSGPKFTDNVRPEWAPRVPPGPIRRLYRDAALGIEDDELVREVGAALFLRCRSIIVANEAAGGRAACPRCETIIAHTRDKRQALTCPGCGWQTTWSDYLATIEGKGLRGGGSIIFAQGFLDTYPLAETAGERIILIDRLIHAFHWELSESVGMSRPVAFDLIAGRAEEVIDFLDTLAYGERTAPEVRREQGAWDQKVARSAEWFRQALAAVRQRRERDQTGD